MYAIINDVAIPQRTLQIVALNYGEAYIRVEAVDVFDQEDLEYTLGSLSEGDKVQFDVLSNSLKQREGEAYIQDLKKDQVTTGEVTKIIYSFKLNAVKP
jgi:hypothetical protein